MSALTDSDRAVIARARELAKVRSATIREFAGEDDAYAAYCIAFSMAQWQVGDLLAIIERIAGEGQDGSEEGEQGG